MEPIKIIIVDDEPIIRKALKAELNNPQSSIACGMNDDGEIEYRTVTVLDTYATGVQLMAALDNPMPHPMPDYLLLDMEFQGEPTGGIFIADRVHRKYPNIRIAILSGRFDNPLPSEGNRTERMIEIAGVVFESLRHGVQAFISKNAAGGFSVENVLRAIEGLERGEKYYFNYPVMMTLKEAAELYVDHAALLHTDIILSDTEHSLLLLEAAGCTASEIADTLHETDKSIQERQKEISRKLNIVNKSGARIARAIQYGLIDPQEIKYLKR